MVSSISHSERQDILAVIRASKFEVYPRNVAEFRGFAAFPNREPLSYIDLVWWTGGAVGDGVADNSYLLCVYV
jgi:hypothetical protein